MDICGKILTEEDWSIRLNITYASANLSPTNSTRPGQRSNPYPHGGWPVITFLSHGTGELSSLTVQEHRAEVKADIRNHILTPSTSLSSEEIKVGVRGKRVLLKSPRVWDNAEMSNGDMWHRQLWFYARTIASPLLSMGTITPTQT